VPPAAWTIAVVAVTLSAAPLAVLLAVVVPGGRSASPDVGLRWLLFVAAPVHVAATACIYTFPEVLHEIATPVRLIWTPVGLIVLLAAVAGATTPSLFAWVLLPSFGWQLWHFQKQNLGVVALAATSRGLPSPTGPQRRVLAAVATAGIAAVSSRPELIQVHLNPHLGWLFPVAAGVFVGSVLMSSLTFTSHPDPVYVTAYLTVLVVWIPLFVFRSPYAAIAGLTIAHGFQYLLLVATVTLGGHRSLPRGRAMFGLAALLLAIGAGLSVASHLHAASGPGPRALYGAYLGLVVSHFVVDAAVWRLRDPSVKRFLARRAPRLVGSPPSYRPPIDRLPI
jgi:hypothetical protein